MVTITESKFHCKLAEGKTVIACEGMIEISGLLERDGDTEMVALVTEAVTEIVALTAITEGGGAKEIVLVTVTERLTEIAGGTESVTEIVGLIERLNEVVEVTEGVTEIVGVTEGVTEIVGVTEGVTEIVGVTEGVTENFRGPDGFYYKDG